MHMPSKKGTSIAGRPGDVPLGLRDRVAHSRTPEALLHAHAVHRGPGLDAY